MIETTLLSRLFLDKGKDIYINNYNKLSKQEINGIRWIYNQYSNKTPGIVINDPPGSGPVKQLVVFLYAVKQCFAPHPVLILSQTENIEHWTKYFQRYSDFSDDLLVEETNPCKKKLIYLNSLETGLKMCNSRSWSMIVVDDNTFTKNILQAKMDTSFKIWITSVDMKKNVKTFALLYKWLHPKGSFAIENFEPDEKSIRDVINKAIMWDTFTQDIVIRAKGQDGLGKESKIQENLTQAITTSKKNKDASGTKIKGTKRKIENESNKYCIDNDDHIPDISFKTIRSSIHPYLNENGSERDSQINLHYSEREDLNNINEFEMDVETSVSNDKLFNSSRESQKKDVVKLFTKTKTDNVDNQEDAVKKDVLECSNGKYSENDTFKNNQTYPQDNDLCNDDFKDLVKSENIQKSIERKEGVKNIHIESTSNKVEKLEANDVKMERSNLPDTVKIEDDIDSEITDIEKKLNEKFKGSLLDSIFSF